MTAAPRRRIVPAALLAVLALSTPAPAADSLGVSFHPARPRAGDVVLLQLRGVPQGAIVDADVAGHPLSVFATQDGYAALFGIDMETPPRAREWRVTVTSDDRVRTARGMLEIAARPFRVQRLTVSRAMVELDPETERRAEDESARLRAVYRAVSGERLWRDRFVRPVAGDEPGTGFGARRIINGQPRAPHSGVDFAAPTGTTVVAANRGRVVLTGEFFFPGRLVILDHGLGLHTAYFHLDTVAVTEGQLVVRGQALGTVGMTGRVTGPHLHFAAQVGTARIDPSALLELTTSERQRAD